MQYRVLRAFEGNGRTYEAGEIIDADQFRWRQQLVEQRFLEPVLEPLVIERSESLYVPADPDGNDAEGGEGAGDGDEFNGADLEAATAGASRGRGRKKDD